MLTVWAGSCQADCRYLKTRSGGLEACVPATWFAKVEPEHRVIMACSRPDGRCWSGVGGFPLSGVATISIRDMRDDVANETESLSQWIGRFLRNEVPVQRLSLAGPFVLAQAKAEEVVRIRADAKDLADAFWTIDYFVAASRPEALVGLQFNTVDPKSNAYRLVATSIVRSLRRPR